MPITLRDVADKAGVSLPTASQILNPTSRRAGLFASSTRERVQAAAVELGYLPNMAARSTSTGRFGAITLLLSSHSSRSQLPFELFSGIEEAVAAADLHLIIARLPDQRLTDGGMIPKLLHQLASDGLLINYNSDIPSRMVELIDRHALPSVWINSKQRHDCIHPDDRKAALAGTRMLLGAGHRKIAFVDYTHGPESIGHYKPMDRRAGYAAAMREVGGKTRIICGAAEVIYSDRISFTKNWLASRDCPTAVLCYSAHESAAILSTADRLGLTIPRDLTVMTIHDQPSQYFDTFLPTLVLPEREIGLRAVAMLLARISGAAPKTKGVAVPLTMAHAECLAPPRRGKLALRQEPVK